MTLPMVDLSDRAVQAPRKSRRPLHRWMMDTLGREWCGNVGPPLTDRKIYVHDDGVIRVFSMQDDGGFVGIGYPDEWHAIIRWKAARMFAWWVLRTWAADWFGLRSHLWGIALNRECRGQWRWKPYPNSDRLTRVSSFDEWDADHRDAGRRES